MSLNIVFIFSNSADSDEIEYYIAFHLGLHYLPKYPFRGFLYTHEGLKSFESLSLCRSESKKKG